MGLSKIVRPQPDVAGGSLRAEHLPPAEPSQACKRERADRLILTQEIALELNANADAMMQQLEERRRSTKWPAPDEFDSDNDEVVQALITNRT